MTAACSPLCDNTCIHVEAEDVFGQRTKKELCEEVEHHCIYTLYLLALKVSTVTLAPLKARYQFRLQLPTCYRGPSHTPGWLDVVSQVWGESCPIFAATFGSTHARKLTLSTLLARAQVGSGVLLIVCSTQGVDTLSNCTEWQLLLWTNNSLLREVIWPPYRHCSSPLALRSQ